MQNITKIDFEKYKSIANDVIQLLCSKNLSTIGDVELIFHIIRGYPYCIDTDGHYTYQGEYFDSLENLPLSALMDVVSSRSYTPCSLQS